MVNDICLVGVKIFPPFQADYIFTVHLVHETVPQEPLQMLVNAGSVETKQVGQVLHGWRSFVLGLPH